MSETVKTPNQKLKLLYLYKILFEKTDDTHCISMPDIISELEQYGISAARKALYDDIEALRTFGVDIVYTKGTYSGYRIGSRLFELSELKLLADGISSSRFLTEHKSNEIIKKLAALTSVYSGKEVGRQLYVTNRLKSGNDKICNNVDKINQAIRDKRKIGFKYFDYDLNKKKKYRERLRICTPYTMVWCNELYYLVAKYDKYPDTLTNFRVDRMENVVVAEVAGEPKPKDFSLYDYLKSSFSMFSGQEESVTLRFANELVNPIIDRFGTDIMIFPYDKDSFIVHTDIKTEQPAPFFGWLFQFGDRAEIITPISLREEFQKMLRKVSELYI